MILLCVGSKWINKACNMYFIASVLFFIKYVSVHNKLHWQHCHHRQSNIQGNVLITIKCLLVTHGFLLQPLVTSQLGTINNLIHVKKSDFEVFDALQVDSLECSDTSGQSVLIEDYCARLIKLSIY